jgi:hypothetical protein
MRLAGIAEYALSTLDPTFTYRLHLYQKKPYPRLTSSRLRDELTQKKRLLVTGETALYLGVYPELEGSQWIWPLFDIDGEYVTVQGGIPPHGSSAGIFP